MSESLPVLSASCSESEFCAAVAIVAKLEHDTKLWLADAALTAQNRWGARGLEIMSSATGFKTCSLKHASYTAAKFPPGKRYEYSYNALRFCKPYANADAAWTDDFLKRHKDEKLSSRDLRALAQKEWCKDDEKKKPVHCRSPKKCSVTIRTDLYARLRMHCPDRPISILISEICEQWIARQPNAPAPVIIETKKMIHVREVNERKAQRQKAKEEKASALAEKRATYAERRTAQLLAGAERIAAKPKRLKKSEKLRIQFVDCKPDEWLDTDDGKVLVKSKSLQTATKFHTEDDAIAAEQKHFEERCYREKIVRCEVCSKSTGNLKRDVFHVRHKFSGEATCQTINRPPAASQASANAQG